MLNWLKISYKENSVQMRNMFICHLFKISYNRLQKERRAWRWVPRAPKTIANAGGLQPEKGRKGDGGYACSRLESYVSLCLCTILISLPYARKLLTIFNVFETNLFNFSVVDDTKKF